MHLVAIQRLALSLAHVSITLLLVPLVFARVLGIGRSSSRNQGDQDQPGQNDHPPENGGSVDQDDHSRENNGLDERGERPERRGVFSGFTHGYARGLRAGRSYENQGTVEDTPAQRQQIAETRPRSKEDQKDRSGIKGFAMELKDEFQNDDVPIVAQALSYTTFLALFPFFIFLAALAGFVTPLLNIANPTQQILDALSGALPSNAATLISEQVGGVVESKNGGLLSLGALLALWAASGAVRALMKAMNQAYDVPESRPFVKKYLMSIGLALLFSAFLIVAAVVFFAGQIWARDILEWIGLTGGWAATLVSWAQWPVVFLLLLVGVSFLYWAAPNIDIPFKLITPGALAFVVVWLIATMGFVFYVSNFGSYNATYGALGGVVVLLIWIFISSLILLLGAEINAMVNERAEPEQMDARRRVKRAEAEAKGKA